MRLASKKTRLQNIEFYFSNHSMNRNSFIPKTDTEKITFKETLARDQICSARKATFPRVACGNLTEVNYLDEMIGELGTSSSLSRVSCSPGSLSSAAGGSSSPIESVDLSLFVSGWSLSLLLSEFPLQADEVSSVSTNRRFSPPTVGGFATDFSSSADSAKQAPFS